MKKIILTSITVLLITNSFSQPKNEYQEISKWLSSVVNLEIYYSKKPDSLLQQKITSLSLYSIYNQDSINNHQKLIKQMTDSLRVYKTGTAVYFKFQDKRFLITARHVIFDQNIEDYHKKHSKSNDDDYYGNGISNMILRIPLSSDKPIKIDKQLSGLSSTKNYILSDSIEDLAIISLNKKKNFIDFADFLDERGVEAITLKDLDTSNKYNYGQDILCIGYPSFGFQKYRAIDSILATAESSVIFDAAVTQGKIAMIDYQQYFFVGDISIMPGNSGGALISNNKLIGIVSRQPNYPIENNSGDPYINANSRFPYAICIKASLILPLIKDLIRQEQSNN